MAASTHLGKTPWPVFACGGLAGEVGQRLLRGQRLDNVFVGGYDVCQQNALAGGEMSGLRFVQLPFSGSSQWIRRQVAAEARYDQLVFSRNPALDAINPADYGVLKDASFSQVVCQENVPLLVSSSDAVVAECDFPQVPTVNRQAMHTQFVAAIGGGFGMGAAVYLAELHHLRRSHRVVGGGRAHTAELVLLGASTYPPDANTTWYQATQAAYLTLLNSRLLYGVVDQDRVLPGAEPYVPLGADQGASSPFVDTVFLLEAVDAGGSHFPLEDVLEQAAARTRWFSQLPALQSRLNQLQQETLRQRQWREEKTGLAHRFGSFAFRAVEFDGAPKVCQHLLVNKLCQTILAGTEPAPASAFSFTTAAVTGLSEQRGGELRQAGIVPPDYQSVEAGLISQPRVYLDQVLQQVMVDCRRVDQLLGRHDHELAVEVLREQLRQAIVSARQQLGLKQILRELRGLREALENLPVAPSRGNLEELSRPLRAQANALALHKDRVERTRMTIRAQIANLLRPPASRDRTEQFMKDGQIAVSVQYIFEQLASYYERLVSAAGEQWASTVRVRFLAILSAEIEALAGITNALEQLGPTALQAAQDELAPVAGGENGIVLIRRPTLAELSESTNVTGEVLAESHRRLWEERQPVEQALAHEGGGAQLDLAAQFLDDRLACDFIRRWVLNLRSQAPLLASIIGESGADLRKVAACPPSWASFVRLTIGRDQSWLIQEVDGLSAVLLAVQIVGLPYTAFRTTADCQEALRKLDYSPTCYLLQSGRPPASAIAPESAVQEHPSVPPGWQDLVKQLQGLDLNDESVCRRAEVLEVCHALRALYNANPGFFREVSDQETKGLLHLALLTSLMSWVYETPAVGE